MRLMPVKHVPDRATHRASRREDAAPGKQDGGGDVSSPTGPSAKCVLVRGEKQALSVLPRAWRAVGLPREATACDVIRVLVLGKVLSESTHHLFMGPVS